MPEPDPEIKMAQRIGVEVRPVRSGPLPLVISWAIL
jgi:hypothetical protein